MDDTADSAGGRAGYRPLSAVCLLVAGAAVATLAIHYLASHPSAPYNVRELFEARHRIVYVAGFSVLLLWLGFAPAWVGDLLARRPKLVGWWGLGRLPSAWERGSSSASR